jgi:hypothetical protein
MAVFEIPDHLIELRWTSVRRFDEMNSVLEQFPYLKKEVELWLHSRMQSSYISEYNRSIIINDEDVAVEFKLTWL